VHSEEQDQTRQGAWSTRPKLNLLESAGSSKSNPYYIVPRTRTNERRRFEGHDCDQPYIGRTKLTAGHVSLWKAIRNTQQYTLIPTDLFSRERRLCLARLGSKPKDGDTPSIKA